MKHAPCTRTILTAILLVPCLGAFTAASAADDARAPSWQWAGWGGGGFFWSCAFHPTNPDILYLGGDVSGLYRTEDQARHWHFINRGLNNYGAFSLAVSKSRPETVYVMTLAGMCRSTNGGADWTPLPETAKDRLDLAAQRPGSVRAVAVDPTDANTVYAGSHGGKLCKSTDGGETWATLDYRQALPEPAVDLSRQPAPHSGKGCLVLSFACDKVDLAKHGRAEKFLSQTGVDWTGYRGASAWFCAPAGAPRLEAQLVVQCGGNWLWQAGPSVAAKPGTWTELTLDFTGLKEMQAVHVLYVVVRCPQAPYTGDLYVDAVALHPAAGGAAGDTVLADWEQPLSVDGWRAGKMADAPFVKSLRQSAGVPKREAGPIGGIAVAEADPKLVLVASRSLGLFRSADAGATWTHRPGPATAASVTIFPANPAILYAACGKEGIWKSVDRGLTWAACTNGLKEGLTVREVVVDPRDANRVHFIGSISWDGTYGRTEDGGATWHLSRRIVRDLAANPTVPDDRPAAGMARDEGYLSTPSNIALSPANPDVLFIAANWINVLSTDGGKTWQERDRGADISCVHDIQFCGSNTYATAMDEGLLVSGDNGASWRQLTPRKYTPGISGHQWRVRVAAVGGTERIVSTVSPWAAGQEYPNAVMRSEDGGKTFAKITAGLPDYLPKPNTMWGQGYARALADDPADPNVLYLGIDGDPEPAKGRVGGGIFKSADGGATWSQLPHQPASRKMFYGLVVDPTDSKRLFWATAGSGLFRSEDAGESWTNVLKYGWLFNVYVSPSGAVYTGDKNLSRSTDHGRTWKQISHFKDDWALIGIASDPADEKRIWISMTTWGDGTQGGVFRTADGGATWQEITGDLPSRKPLVLRYNATTRELWAGHVGIYRLPQ